MGQIEWIKSTGAKEKEKRLLEASRKKWEQNHKELKVRDLRSSLKLKRKLINYYQKEINLKTEERKKFYKYIHEVEQTSDFESKEINLLYKELKSLDKEILLFIELKLRYEKEEESMVNKLYGKTNNK